jgi:TP53 regulating kinase-like protein
MPYQIIAQGAEAILKKQGNELIKTRIKKGYRLEELDERLRTRRTRSEAKILDKLSKIINVPKLIKVDEKNKEIIMEFIEGKKLSENLEKLPHKQICFQLGQEIAKIHNQGIIHGDLTTSNMIYAENSKKADKTQEKFNKSSDIINNKVFIIDFGLGFHSIKLEDKAVDLHLLKQALEAKHFTIWREAFQLVLRGYDNKLVEAQLKKVEKRGRYKH